MPFGRTRRSSAARREQDAIRKRVNRQNEDFRRQERQRDAEAHRARRKDEEVRQIEQQRNTKAHRRRRENEEFRQREQQQNTEAHRKRRARLAEMARISKKKAVVGEGQLSDQQFMESKIKDVKVEDAPAKNLEEEEDVANNSNKHNIIYIIEEHGKEDTANNNSINNNNNNNNNDNNKQLLSATVPSDPLSTAPTSTTRKWKPLATPASVQVTPSAARKRRPLAAPAPAQDEQSKKFQCKVCHLWYRTRYFLRKHIFIEHGDQVLECQVCSFIFDDPEKLTSHVIKKHSMEKKLTYDDDEDEVLVEPKAPGKIMMADGMVMGRGSWTKKEYSCSMCDRVLVSRQSLERHELWHTGEKPYQCNVCDYSTCYEEHVQRHMISVHLIIRSDARWPKYVPKHKRVKEVLDSEEEEAENDDDDDEEEEEEEDKEEGDSSKTNRVTSCFRNGRTIIDQSVADSTSSTSPPSKKRRNIKQLRFQCAVCGIRDTHKLHLSKHIRECHPKALIESVVNEDGSKVHLIAQRAKKYKEKRNITCPFCPKVWHDTWKYKMHIRSHTGVKPYGCTECKFLTTTKTTVRDHIERKHFDVPDAKITLKTIDNEGNVKEVKIDVPKKEVRCDICLEVFRSKYDLKFHSSRAHPDVLPFRCRICNLKDNLRATIIIHCMTEHKDEDIDSCIEHKGKLTKIGNVKLPTCDLCGKMFPFQSKLNVHMKFHTGEKKFSCDICSYKTNTKKSLENHLIKCHLEGKPKRKSSHRSKNDHIEEEDLLSNKRLKQEEEEVVVVKEEEEEEWCDEC